MFQLICRRKDHLKRNDRGRNSPLTKEALSRLRGIWKPTGTTKDRVRSRVRMRLIFFSQRWLLICFLLLTGVASFLSHFSEELVAVEFQGIEDISNDVGSN